MRVELFNERRVGQKQEDERGTLSKQEARRGVGNTYFVMDIILVVKTALQKGILEVQIEKIDARMCALWDSGL